MYDKIKQEIAQNYYQQHFSNDGQRFVAWYVRNIHGQNPNQARYCITDGADDKQIDAIVIDDDAQAVYVIQGKFIGAHAVDAEPLREVLCSWVGLKNLASLQEKANPRLKQKLTDLSIALDDSYDVHFELITTGELTESAQHALDTFQKELAASEDLPATLTLVNSEELRRRYELALEKESPFLKHELTLTDGKYMSLEIAGTSVVIAAFHCGTAWPSRGSRTVRYSRRMFVSRLGFQTVSTSRSRARSTGIGTGISSSSITASLPSARASSSRTIICVCRD